MEILNLLLQIFARIVVKNFVLMIAGTVANHVTGVRFTFGDYDLYPTSYEMRYFKQASEEERKFKRGPEGILH